MKNVYYVEHVVQATLAFKINADSEDAARTDARMRAVNQLIDATRRYRNMSIGPHEVRVVRESALPASISAARWLAVSTPAWISAALLMVVSTVIRPLDWVARLIFRR
jgi:hypothetical protein